MKINNLNLLVGIVFYFFVIELHSQDIFESKIIDSINKFPIAYATIKIKNSNFGTYSDSIGRFRLNLKSKSDTVIISSLGYKTKTLIIDDLIKDSEQVFLSENIDILNEVYISDYVNKGTWHKPFQKSKMFCNTFLYEGSTLKIQFKKLNDEINGLRFYLLYPSSDMTIIVRPIVTNMDGTSLLKKDYTKTFNLKSQKNQKIEFLFDEDINIPIEGVYLGLETISVPDNNNYTKSVQLQCSNESSFRTEMTTIKNFVQQNNIIHIFDKAIDSGIYIEIKKPK